MKKIFIILFLLASLSAKGQVTFTDVSVALGVNDPGAAQGCAFVDVNNDGFQDIYVLNNNTPNKLYINNGGVSFTEASVLWNIGVSVPGRGFSCADYNNDGKIDIMVGNWQTAIILYKNLGTSFSDVASSAGVNLISYGGSINWIDYNNDGKIDAVLGNDGVPYHYNYLFKNNDLNTFSNVAYQVGLVDSLSTLTLASADYDNDGDLDLFCGSQTSQGANGTGVLYKNNGDGTFTDVTFASGLITSAYSWGAHWGDYNNDGYMDIALGNSNAYSTVYKNNGNGTFTDVSATLGILDVASTYSVGWADYDNDGDLDLYIARGQTYADKLYRNDGSVFTDVAGTVGMGDLRHSSCISWGDFNNDGFLDLYLNNNGTENRLYKNNAGNSNKWFILNLQGTNTNRSAIGTRVTVKTGSLMQIREVEGGSGGKGQNSLPVEFGLGSATIIDTLKIRWYSGLTQTFVNVTPNRIVNLVEGGTLGLENNTGIIPEKFRLSQNYPNPFNPSTKIRYEIPSALSFSNVSIGVLNVSLTVFDALGRDIATLVNETKPAGVYEVTFDGSNLPSGIYFYRLISGDYSETKAMLLIK